MLVKLKWSLVSQGMGTCWDFGGQVTDLHKAGDMKSRYGHHVNILRPLWLSDSLIHRDLWNSTHHSISG